MSKIHSPDSRGGRGSGETTPSRPPREHLALITNTWALPLCWRRGGEKRHAPAQAPLILGEELPASTCGSIKARGWQVPRQKQETGRRSLRQGELWVAHQEEPCRLWREAIRPLETKQHQLNWSSGNGIPEANLPLGKIGKKCTHL